MPLNAIQIKMLKNWFDIRNLTLDRELQEKIIKYQEKILNWSSRINLVSKGDRATIIENHILDSLGPIEMIPRHGRMIDIGTGAGFPGIPIAMVRPRLHITLVESVHKKVLFLRSTRAELRLDNIEIIEGRVENLLVTEKYDVATMRALPRWESLIDDIKIMLRPGGKIIYYQRRGTYTTILI
jgi:16S rRNA (guanine527-N7)-methyltransferase